MRQLADIPLTPSQLTALGELRRRILSEFDIEEMVLYGSVARGEADAESDVDRRAGILGEAETLLVRDEAPVIPLWFEVGFGLYRPDKVRGIHANPLDTHPFGAIERISPSRGAAPSGSP